MSDPRDLPLPDAATDPAPSLTVLICTHNRVELLTAVIASLNAARRPAGTSLRLFVVANACSDGTHAFLDAYASCHDAGRLPLEWVAEPTPGKSHALNRALPMLSDAVVAFVDDDHRVDAGYLEAVAEAARNWPEAGLLCGRILPDWDGSEPPWVHDDGPYRIYPLPVPRYDQGETAMRVDIDGGIPGGGNLVARLAVAHGTGPFQTDLGPTGHDLGGSEDVEWIRRAMRNGAVLRYAPGIVQYHYVDGARLTLPYLLKKGFQRSKSVMRFRHAEGGVPLYMWRKVGGYAVKSGLAISAQARRFYLVRLAASLGEISGMREAAMRRRRRARLPLLGSQARLGATGALGLGGFALAGVLAGHRFDDALVPAAVVALVMTLVLMLKSALDFSRTGPRMRDEIMSRYRIYVPFAMARLGLWTFFTGLFLALPGAFLAVAWAAARARPPDPLVTTGAAMLTLVLAFGFTFCLTLVHNPGLIVASWQYHSARLHRLWGLLSASGLRRVTIAVGGLMAVLCALLSTTLVAHEGVAMAAALAALLAGYLGALGFALEEPDSPLPAGQRDGTPNLVLIGSDTLRADRVGAQRNGHSLTPNIDALARRGTLFGACYVPCARTAPSLLSMFTGTWPHTHGIRDNFVADEETRLDLPALPSVLGALGYRSAAVSDWCGADLGKFSLGFDILDLPNDQWNLKYLIRQGPKDIRLFLSLFLHNRIGRMLLPEIHYLGGVPQTTQLGQRGRRMVSRLAATGEPFMVNLFYSTTHPPFASEHPYYVRHASPDYGGASKFAMARLTEPFEIIRRQGEPREEFDLDQIRDLYDGCVAQFDAEVGKMLRHIEASGLADNTIVVVYSDHGMEFFEHGTWGQGNSALGDFSARIPLVIAAPGQASGQRVDQVVRSIDLMPTLLDLIQAPSVKCDGRSVLPAMLNPAHDLELKAFNETGIWITPIPGLPEGHLRYPDLLELLDVPDDAIGTLAIKAEYRDIVLLAKDRMVRDGRWKLVYQPLETGCRLALYDVVADPGCTRDLVRDHPLEVARLWAELREWMDKDPVLRRKAQLELS